MGRKIYSNFSLFDGVQPTLQKNRWLETESEMIKQIGSGELPQDAEVIDLEGRTIMPGMIDAHVHITSPFVFAPEVFPSVPNQVKKNFFNTVRSGVTTVRDVGGGPGLLTESKRWSDEGEAVGPRMLRANSYILAPGATPEMIGPFPPVVKSIFGGDFVVRVNTPQEVRQAVRDMIALGADWIKTTHNDRSYFMNRPDPTSFSDECYRALVDEAHSHNKPVLMHQTWASGFRKAVEMGVDTMDHGPLDEITDQDIENMLKADVAIIPTIKVMREPTQDISVFEKMIYEDGETYLCPAAQEQIKPLLQMMKKGLSYEDTQMIYFEDCQLFTDYFPTFMNNMKRLYKAGARIGCGTDQGNLPFSFFGNYHEEVENMVEIGMSNFEALCCATSTTAKILRVDDKVGSLEPGKFADFIVLDGNPLEDVKVLRKIHTVVKGGSAVYRQGDKFNLC